MATKPIEILINAKDKASGVLGGIVSKVAGLGGILAGVGAAVGSIFSLRTFAGAVQGAAEFEAALSRVQAATGATADEMAALKQAAEDAGASTKFTSSEAAGALETLGKAGLSAADAVTTLTPVLNLAQAADLELGEAAEYVTKAVAGMGLEFEDAARVADVLAKGANASNTSVAGLGQALSYVAPIAKATGLSLEETVAIAGKLADAGIDASRAGTGLSSILSQFSDPAGKFRRALGDAGITTNDFSQALRQLAAAGPKGEEAIRAVGLNAGPALRALLGQGMDALDELTDSLRNAEGSAAATAAVMQDNLQGSMTGLSSALDTLKNVLGTPILPVLKDGVDALAGSIRGWVADGTIQALGDSLAQAFRSGLRYIQEFIGAVDAEAIKAKLQGWADGFGSTMAKIGEYASTAGNLVQTAWGVMSAGANTVLALIYKLGDGFATVASGIQSGLATIVEGVSKITFGDVSARFAAMAEEIRLSAEATGAVAEALGDAAARAMDRAADGAETARAGFAGLAGAAGQAKTATENLIGATDQLADAHEKAGEAAEKAGQKAAKSAADQAQAAQDAQGKVAALRAEYEQAVQTGNWQRAAEVMQQLRSASDGAAQAQGRIKDAANDAAANIAQAFQQAGVKTKEALGQLAENARANFDTIKASNQATAAGLADAWHAAAQAAIDATDGTMVPAWVSAEAAVYGYRLEVDAAGDNVLVTAEKTKQSTDKIAGGWREAKKAKDLYEGGGSGDKHAEEQEKTHAKIARTIRGTWASATTEASKYADAAKKHAHEIYVVEKNTAQGLTHLWGHTLGLFKRLRQNADDYVRAMEGIDAVQARLYAGQSDAAAGVDDLRMRLLELTGTEAEVAAAQAARQKAAIELKIKEAQLDIERAGWDKDYARAGQLQEEIKHFKEQLKLVDQIAAAEEKQRKAAAKEDGTSAAGTASRRGGVSAPGPSAPGPSAPVGPSYISNISIAGGQPQQLRFADASSQSAAEQLLRQLSQAQQVAA